MESVCWGNSTVGSNPTLSAISPVFLSFWVMFCLRSRIGSANWPLTLRAFRRTLAAHVVLPPEFTVFDRLASVTPNALPFIKKSL